MTKPEPTLAVSVCLLRGDEVLLVERGNAPWKGVYSLPGGRLEFGETLADAAARELREETGIREADLAFLRLHEAIDAANGIHVVIAVFTAPLREDAAFEAGDDADSIRFASSDALQALQRAGRLTPGLLAIIADARQRLAISAMAAH